MTQTTIPTLGLVVIGRNEGERLRRCLASVIAADRTVVYVDSGSTDGSTELARSMGAHVVDLDMSRPFSASRGRNAGLARLLELAPDTTPGIKYVQFVDGDCEVSSSWLPIAVAALESEPTTAAVCGRLRELHPDASLYNRLCDIEWDAPPGIVRSCGGNAMYRVAALRAVGGFNDDVVAGEEPELCYRLRQAGHTIRRLPDDMALHDADMHTFRQWWKRAARGGWALAHGAALHGKGSERFNVRRIRSVLFWAAVWPAFILLWAIAMRCLHFFHPSPQVRLVTIYVPDGLPVLLYFALFVRITLRQRARGRPWRIAVIVAQFTIYAKFAELTGILRFWLRRRAKSPTSPPTFDKRPASA